VFNRTVKPLLDRREPRVLDIGSGTGFYVERWRELGVRTITGSDITSKSVRTLAARFAEHRFAQFDIGGADPPFKGETFDFISAIAVLYHIVDDNSYERAFRNLSSLLEPGGFLVFSDSFLPGRLHGSAHQALRAGAEIESVVRGAGLDILVRRPMFVLSNRPVNSDSRLLHTWWRWLHGLARASDAAGWTAGALLYPLELASVELARRAPSLELAVCRKPRGDDFPPRDR
jgi:SAM-dependent methyltransferase